ncbi:MAG: ribonuclease, partial [Acidobacteria bacterium]|nr:ribonuclease [Acidobacteriota bacterium]
MAKEMFVSSSLHETRVAVLDDGALVEVYFQREQDVGLVGGIYKGRVNRVLPGMQSAFVEIGLERDAFLYVSDFYEESDEYEKMDTDLEQKGKRPVIDLSEKGAEKGAKKETDVKAAPAQAEPAVTEAASEPSVEIPPVETSPAETSPAETS